MKRIRKSHIIWQKMQNKKEGDKHSRHNHKHLLFLGYVYGFGSSGNRVKNNQNSDDNIHVG